MCSRELLGCVLVQLKVHLTFPPSLDFQCVQLKKFVEKKVRHLSQFSADQRDFNFFLVTEARILVLLQSFRNVVCNGIAALYRSTYAVVPSFCVDSVSSRYFLLLSKILGLWLKLI